MSFFHLLNSRAKVWRRSMTRTGGMPSFTYAPVRGMGYVPCRVDLKYVTGKDTPPPAVAGKAPDRYGWGFFEADTPIKAGDRLEMVPNELGEIPDPGTFEIRSIPDSISGSRSRHHLEVQVWESQQEVNDLWPSDKETS